MLYHFISHTYHLCYRILWLNTYFRDRHLNKNSLSGIISQGEAKKIMKTCEREGPMRSRVACERELWSPQGESEREPVLHVCRQTAPSLPSAVDPRVPGPHVVGFSPKRCNNNTNEPQELGGYNAFWKVTKNNVERWVPYKFKRGIVI